MTPHGTEFDVALPPLTLEAGRRLARPRLHGWRWGREDGPVVLVVHALTADAHVDAWWPGVVGVGRALDPRTHHLLCFNNLGGCYGSSGPADPDWPRWSADDAARAEDVHGLGPEAGRAVGVTPWDQARALLAALDALGIDRVERLVGGSLGGMIALCLAVLDPARFGAVVALATDVRATPWVIGWNHVGRQAVRQDPDRGLSLARQLAHLSYRANPGLELRQGRDQVWEGPGWSPAWPYRMQTYLEHQGAKLRRRFEPEAYVVQLDAMDHHDLGRRPVRDAHEFWDPTGPWGEARLPEALHLVGIDTDQLFPPGPLRALATRRAGAVYHEIRSPHGHDGFLLAARDVARVLHAAAPARGEEVACRTVC